MIKTGTIVKGIAGFYYVEAGGIIYECKAKGVFKKKGEKPYVGDLVDIDCSDDTPVVSRIHERENCFERPPVANVDQFVVVSALTDPEPNLAVVDRFLVMAEMYGLDIVLCFTKADLVSEEQIEGYRDIYSRIYPTLFVDCKREGGINTLIPYLKGKKTALAGPSGVGKSTITGALRRDLSIETGNVSAKTGRGKHTTRHVELFSLDFGGMIFDTPGFTSFDVPDLDEDRLQFMFPEIDRLVGECRFNGCRHLNEPGCAVRDACDAGEISKERYDSYCSQLKDIKERERKKYY